MALMVFLAGVGLLVRWVRKREPQSPVVTPPALIGPTSLLDPDLADALDAVQVDTTQAAAEVITAWTGSRVTSAVWDEHRGSLLLEASGLTAALALPDEEIANRIEAMVSLERTWVMGCFRDDGSPLLWFRSQSWRYAVTPLGIAVLVRPEYS